MPATRTSDVRLSEAAVRAAVIRLARPDGDGGAVIERAAILAEGTPSAAIEAWIIDHGGQPEARTELSHGSRLRGLRPEQPPLGDHRPRRYMIPLTALTVGGDTPEHGAMPVDPRPSRW